MWASVSSFVNIIPKAKRLSLPRDKTEKFFVGAHLCIPHHSPFWVDPIINSIRLMKKMRLREFEPEIV